MFGVLPAASSLTVTGRLVAFGPANGACRGDLAGWLGEALVDVQGEFQRGQGAGGFDQVFRAAGQAGQHMVDHRRIRRAGGRRPGPERCGALLGFLCHPAPRCSMAIASTAHHGGLLPRSTPGGHSCSLQLPPGSRSVVSRGRPLIMQMSASQPVSSVRTGSESGRLAPPPRSRSPSVVPCDTRSTAVVLATVR